MFNQNTIQNKIKENTHKPKQGNPDRKIHGATWGRQDPGGPHVGHMNFAIWKCNWKSMLKQIVYLIMYEEYFEALFIIISYVCDISYVGDNYQLGTS